MDKRAFTGLIIASVAFGLNSFAADSPPQAPKQEPLPTPPAQLPPADAAFPLPGPAKDPSQLGLGVQRTMTLLATSTPEHRHHVRILFYGQSITEQEWSKQVADDLRRRFPNADLEIENRAIGGFASQLLIRPAEHDLYPFYPDLLIFHVFGANQQYEQIIKSTRTRTTAEVLMQTDRITKFPPAVIDREQDKGMWWDDLMNHHLLPEIAAKYRCGLCDIHDAWIDYLHVNHLEPPALLVKDVTHLNAHGNFLMAQLTSRYLVYRAELPTANWSNLTRTYEIGKDANFERGHLTIEFEGNRVDFLPRTTGGGGSAHILIDGKKSDEFPGAYRITRPEPGPWTPLFLSRVDHDAPLKLETWTLKLTSVAPDFKTWTFNVSGSITGDDGSGKSDEPFVSKSGRVKIDPAAWFRAFNPPLPNGYVIHWLVKPMFAEAWEPAKIDDVTKENAVTMIQGIPNGRHTLEVIADDAEKLPAITSVRTFKPPVAE